MTFAELVPLLLYSAQQLGVTLGVGAATVLLVTYLLGLHEGHEKHLSTAYEIQWVERAGIALIVLSGLGIVALHAVAGAFVVLVQPAFLFKWALIVLVVGTLFVERWLHDRHEIWQVGIAGGLWFALFLVHTLPQTFALHALLLYSAIWMVAFCAIWWLFVWIVGRHDGNSFAWSKAATPTPLPPPPAPVVPPAPVPAATPAPTPKPAPLPIVQPLEIEQPHIAVAPMVPASQPVVAPAPAAAIPKAPTAPHVTEETADISELPALRVMPQTPEQLANQNRGSVVKLD